MMDLVSGDIRKAYFRFLIPAISGAIAIAAYSLVDTIAIGQGVGADGTAACAIVLPVFSIANFIALLCGIGGSVLRSRARGEGNEEKGNAYFTAGVCLVSIFTAVAWVVFNLLQNDFYRLCGADEKIMPYAAEYGRWIFLFMPSFVITAFLGAFIRADGSPRFVLVSTLTGGAVNIIGDWLFVFPLKMGMKGAAIATVLGSAIQAMMLLIYVLSGRTTIKPARPYQWIKAARKIIGIGFGAGIGAISVIVVSFIANNQIMRYCGAPSLAVYGVLGTVSALLISIYSGVGQAVQPIVSENYGAGKIDRCLEAEHLGMQTAVLLGITFSAICIAFPLPVTGFFMKMNDAVKEVAPYILRVYALSFIPLSINIFAVYYLQSVSEGSAASLLSLARGMVLNGIFLFLFPVVFGGNGVWWAVFAAECITAVYGCSYLSRTNRNNHFTHKYR